MTARPNAALAARLQAQRQAMNAATAATLAPAEVANWLTLQTLILTQPGVCTEPEMFYRSEVDGSQRRF